MNTDQPREACLDHAGEGFDHHCESCMLGDDDYPEPEELGNAPSFEEMGYTPSPEYERFMAEMDEFDKQLRAGLPKEYGDTD